MARKLDEHETLANPALDLPRAVGELAAPAYVISRDGRYSWVNQPFIELFGDLRGQSFVDRVAPEDRQLSRTNFARKVVGKTTQIFDLRCLDQADKRVKVRISSAPLRRGGAVVGVFGIAVPLDRDVGRVDRHESLLSDLTPRQLEVLRLLSEGKETQEIAARLGIADETARNHIRGVLRATGAHSRLEAVVIGFRAGLLEPHLTQPGQQGAADVADE